MDSNSKPLFKCLTNANADPAQPRSVPLKQKFSKLTLSSSNKKNQRPPDDAVADKPHTPTPKMLSYDSDDEGSGAGSQKALITDDEDSVGDDGGGPPVAAAATKVNKILESSASTPSCAAVAAADAIAAPCEGPSFSQRLQMNDTDITNCTELNTRRSSILPKPRSSLAIVAVVAAPEIAYNQTLSQMEKLELSASSEDLFAGSDCNVVRSSDDAYPMASQMPCVQPALSVSDQIELPSSDALPQPTPPPSIAAAAVSRRQTVYTVSSSSSASSERSAPQPVDTRSSLASEDVYDVITLSDSMSDRQTSDDEPDEGNDAGDAAPVGCTSPDRIAGRSNPGIVNVSPPLVVQQPLPSAESLSSIVQRRLDNFFDNIPMLGSNTTPSKPAGVQTEASPVPVESPKPLAVEEAGSLASKSRDTSVYVSETDEEPASPPPVRAETPDRRPATPIATVSSDLVPSTQRNVPVSSTQSSATNSARKVRTPVVNIAAKFQIHIQVNHNESTSESSTSPSSSNTSRASCNNGPKADAPAEATSAADVNEKMSELCIAEVAPQINGRSRTKTPQRNNTPQSAKRLQLDRLQARNASPQPAAASAPLVASPPQASEAESVRPPPVTMEHTPSKPKIVLDDAAQKLLNDLYGASWQTPDLMKKCVIRRPAATAVKKPNAAPQQVRSSSTESAGKSERSKSRGSQDFSLFRRAIASHLDSTRIGDVIKSPPKAAQVPVVDIPAEVGSPFFKKPAPVVSVTPKTRRSSMGAIKSARKNVPGRIADSDSDEEEITPVEKAMAMPSGDCQNETTPRLPRSARKKVPARIDDSDSDDTAHPVSKPVPVPDERSGRSMRRCRLNATKPQKLSDLTSSLSSSSDDKENAGAHSSDDDWQAEPEPISRRSTGSRKSSGSSRNSSTSSLRRRKPVSAATEPDDAGNLTYLDLTHAEVVEDEDHQAPDASAEDLEAIGRKLLADYEYQPKPGFVHPSSHKTPVHSSADVGTPAKAPLTKRKLYNPAYEDLEHAIATIYSPHNITPVVVDLPKLAASQDDEIDENALVDDPSLRVKLRGKLLPLFLQNPRLNDLKLAEPPASAPQRTPKKTTPGTPKTPATLAEIMHTPHGKYSFLESLDVHVAKNLLHPVALMFREKFKAKKEQLTTLLLELYAMRLFKDAHRLDVPVTWNKKLTKTAGLCQNRRRAGVRTASIELSDKVITSADRLRCTLIHELCHAATWVHNGDTGHGATWKRWAALANARLPELPAITRCHSYDIEYKYVYLCTLCGAKSPSHSKSKKVERIRCAYCHGAIEIFLNKTDAAGRLCPTPMKKVTGFAAFVKCEYRTFKAAGVTHAEVMRLLSAKYAELTVEQKKQY